MELDELAQRLAILEAARAEEQENARRQMFMDKYGHKFANDKNLGLFVLNELDRNGEDVSAADDAIQRILDQVRMENQMLSTAFERLDGELKEELKEAIKNNGEKIATMQEAFDKAQPKTTEETMQNIADTVAQDDAGQIPPEAQVEQIPIEQGAEVMQPEQIPPEAQAEQIPPEASIPEQIPEPIPEPVGDTPSDVRLKNIRGAASGVVRSHRLNRLNTMLSDLRAKKVTANKSNDKADDNGSTIPSSIINGCRG